ncbi:MAG: preprotein translocase subunit SecY [Pirellulaceae bacterium]
MLEKIRVVFTIPELRKKIFLTLFLLAVYRVGWQIPLPIVDHTEVSQYAKDMNTGFGSLLQKVSVFSASRLNQITIFGLGIMPYITASIILQLLGTIYPPLVELRKEGEAGRKKINEYTRYLTVVLCLFQSLVFLRMVVMAGGNPEANLTASAFENTVTGNLTFGWQIVSVLIMTCGSLFLMWLGEQIDEYGIGNGISLLIMAGIVAAMPEALRSFLQTFEPTLTGLNANGIEKLVMLIAIFIAVVVAVVFITMAQRRIPTQSAKHVRGRKVYGGTRQYMPLRINQAGVMPIIFASSLLMLPTFLLDPLSRWMGDSSFGIFLGNVNQLFSQPLSMFYNLAYIVLIYFFCYFWTAISFNPQEISQNFKDSNTFIPGYRPGKRTADYLENVMERITFVGAGFLALVAIVPTLITSWFKVDPNLANFYGGTGLLIAVSVAFDLVQKIDSHLVMRNYTGLLE